MTAKQNMQLITATFLILVPAACFSQGMINNGATITITTGSVVYIDGDALGKYTNSVNGALQGNIDLNGSMYVEGDWVNNAATSNVFINNTAAPWGTVFLNGAVASNITGTRKTEFENLTILNANRTLQITDCEVNNILTLNTTSMILNQKKFIIDNTAAAGITTVATGNVRSESTAAPFGEIQWNIGAATGANYVVPFATATPVLIPFTYRPTSGTTGNLLVATYPTNAANLPFPPTVTHVNNYYTGADNSAMTVNRFWEFIVAGPVTANVNYRCTPAEAAGIPNPRAQRWVAITNAWEYPYQGAQATAVTGTDVTGVAAQNSWWTLADITSPLPVELVSFEGTCNKMSSVILQWETASETNNKSFEIEKSTDGLLFETVASVDGAGTSSASHKYSYTDSHISYNSIPRSYYRLSQTDYDGTVRRISDVINVGHCKTNGTLTATVIYDSEHPVLIIDAPVAGAAVMNIATAAGVVVQSNRINLIEGANFFDLQDASLSNAVYFISIAGTNGNVATKYLKVN